MLDDDPVHEWANDRRSLRIERLTSRIPPVHRGTGDLNQRVAEWAGKLRKGHGGNLALVGGTGSGKTWQAWHAAVAALYAGFDGSVEFVAADVFRARTLPRHDHGHWVEIKAMGEADLLVLDDIGAHRGTDWWMESMYAVINARYDWMRPTVLTSNVTDLRAELGERIASRLSQDLVLVVLDGPDRRRA